jgi:hypothetical protein
LASVFLGAQAAEQGAGGPHKEIVLSIEQNINGNVSSGDVKLLFADAPELPYEAPAAFGVLLSQNGDLITLGGGAIEVEVSQEIINNEEKEPKVSVNHSGSQISFRINDETEYLQDTTRVPEVTSEEIEAGQVIVPGTVNNSSLQELINLFEDEEPLILRVWGREKDGVILADLVVFEVIE